MSNEENKRLERLEKQVAELSNIQQSILSSFPKQDEANFWLLKSFVTLFNDRISLLDLMSTLFTDESVRDRFRHLSSRLHHVAEQGEKRLAEAERMLKASQPGSPSPDESGPPASPI